MRVTQIEFEMFRQWVLDQGYKENDGKGNYQLFRFTTGKSGEPMPICYTRNEPDSITLNKSAAKYYHMYQRDKNKNRLAAELGATVYAVHKIEDHNNIQGGVAQMDIFAITNPKPGSYRYTRPDTGEVITVQPGERMYSTASILATEMFDGVAWVGME